MCVASFGSLNISRSGMHVEIYVFQTASKQNTFFHYTFLTFLLFGVERGVIEHLIKTKNER